MPSVRLGYALSSEEHRPTDLVADARRAEAAGFEHALISDHFLPWIDKQGQSPFAWSVLGGIAAVTSRLRVGTGVTCPTIRYHPAIIAQAAATVAAMMPGRFFLGLGSGERLNEHIVGAHWPDARTRLAMLEEAVSVIRELWTGDLVTHHGEHVTVEEARIYTLPESLPPILLAASGQEAAELAGRIADGLVATAPSPKVVTAFEQARAAERHAQPRPRYAQASVCWAPTEDAGRKTLRTWWPNAGIPGHASQEIALPAHFEELASLVTDDALADIPCGPDAGRVRASIDAYAEAGFDHVYVHQIGPDQAGFIDFCEREILPHYA